MRKETTMRCPSLHANIKAVYPSYELKNNKNNHYTAYEAALCPLLDIKLCDEAVSQFQNKSA